MDSQLIHHNSFSTKITVKNILIQDNYFLGDLGEFNYGLDLEESQAKYELRASWTEPLLGAFSICALFVLGNVLKNHDALRGNDKLSFDKVIILNGLLIYFTNFSVRPFPLYTLDVHFNFTNIKDPQLIVIQRF